MKLKSYGAAVLLFCVCSGASAQSSIRTGNDFLRVVEQMDRTERDGRTPNPVELGQSMLLLGFVMGLQGTNAVIEALIREEKGSLAHVACIPKEVSVGQLVKVLKAEFEKTPQLLHYSTHVLAQMTLPRVYPC